MLIKVGLKDSDITNY